MSSIFEKWDDTKSRTNLQKHGISFEEASTVFVDELALIVPDPGNASEEERFIIFGMSLSLRYGGCLLSQKRRDYSDHFGSAGNAE